MHSKTGYKGYYIFIITKSCIIRFRSTITLVLGFFLKYIHLMIIVPVASDLTKEGQLRIMFTQCIEANNRGSL